MAQNSERKLCQKLTDDTENGSPMAGALKRFQPIDTLPELLTPEEFRAFAGIGRSTMYDLLRRDEIPHIRFGRCIRIPKAALVASNVGVK